MIFRCADDAMVFREVFNLVQAQNTYPAADPAMRTQNGINFLTGSWVYERGAIRIQTNRSGSVLADRPCMNKKRNQ